MTIAEDLYEKLTNEEDARLCLDIDDRACRESPRSFVCVLGSYFLTKLGDAVANPKTTLAWLTTVVGAPPVVLGLLVPIRESGSLIPQLFIGGVVRRLPLRKWVWVGGSVMQGLCILGIGFTAWHLRGAAAGWSIVALTVLFSLARGFCSVAAKDVLGKTIPKKVRGQLNGWSASAAGLVTIGVGAVLLRPPPELESGSLIGTLLIAAGCLWLLAALVYAQIPEHVGETGGGRSILEELGKLRLLSTDAPFRRFVLTRSLLMSSALSAPFYVALAQEQQGSGYAVLGAFVIAGGLASLCSAPLWGRFADRSSRWVMVVAALLTAVVGFSTAALDRFDAIDSDAMWLLPGMYFLLSIAHSGVRVGRKTYVVDLASGNKRTDYVAISNTVIGVALLLFGSVGALTPILGTGGVIALLAVMGLGGALLGVGLPETEED